MIDLFLWPTKKLKDIWKIKDPKSKLRGNIKLISKINFQKIDEENEKRLEELDFGLLPVFIRKKIFFV